MNCQKGFVVPLLLALIALVLIGGGTYVYNVQKNQENQPATGSVTLPQATSTIQAAQQTTSTTQTSDSQTTDWKTYTKFGSEFSFKYPPQWHVTEYTRNGEGQVELRSIVAVKFVFSQANGTDINSNGSFSFDPREDSDYILVYREFMAQPECTFLTQKTSQLSESGKVVHSPDWPDAKCVEPFSVTSPHYLPYALFTPSKNPVTLEIFNQILPTFKFNQ